MPSDAAVYRMRAYAWGEKGSHDKAIADLDKAISLDDKDAKSFYRRGWHLEAKGDLAKAKGDFAEAARLDPDRYAKYVEK